MTHWMIYDLRGEVLHVSFSGGRIFPLPPPTFDEGEEFRSHSFPKVLKMKTFIYVTY